MTKGISSSCGEVPLFVVHDEEGDVTITSSEDNDINGDERREIHGDSKQGKEGSTDDQIVNSNLKSTLSSSETITKTAATNNHESTCVEASFSLPLSAGVKVHPMDNLRNVSLGSSSGSGLPQSRRTFSFRKSFGFVMKGFRSCCNIKCHTLLEKWLKSLHSVSNVWDYHQGCLYGGSSTSSQPAKPNEVMAKEKSIITAILQDMNSSDCSLKCCLDYLLILCNNSSGSNASGNAIGTGTYHHGSMNGEESLSATKKNISNCIFLLLSNGFFRQYMRMVASPSLKVLETINKLTTLTINSGPPAAAIAAAAKLKSSMEQYNPISMMASQKHRRSSKIWPEFGKHCDSFELSILHALVSWSDFFWTELPEVAKLELLDLLIALVSRPKKSYLDPESRATNNSSIASIHIIVSNLKHLCLHEKLAPSFPILMRLSHILSTFAADYVTCKKQECDADILDALMLSLTRITSFALKYHSVILSSQQKGRYSSKMWPSFLDGLFSTLKNIYTLNLLDGSPFIPKEKPIGVGSITHSFSKYQWYGADRLSWLSHCSDICLLLLDMTCRTSSYTKVRNNSSTSMEDYVSSPRNNNNNGTNLKGNGGGNNPNNVFESMYGKSMAVKVACWVTKAMDSSEWMMRPAIKERDGTAAFGINVFSLDYPNLYDLLEKSLSDFQDKDMTLAVILNLFIKDDLTSMLSLTDETATTIGEPGLKGSNSDISSSLFSGRKGQYASPSRLLSSKLLSGGEKIKKDLQYVGCVIDLVSVTSSCIYAITLNDNDDNNQHHKVLVERVLWPLYLCLQEGLCKSHPAFGNNSELINRISFTMTCLLSTGFVPKDTVNTYLENSDSWFSILFCPLFRNVNDFLVLSRRRPKYFRNRFMNMPSHFHKKTIKLRYSSEFCSSEILFLRFLANQLSLLESQQPNDTETASSSSPSPRKFILDRMKSLTSLLAIDAAMFIVMEYMVRGSIALKKRIQNPCAKVPFAATAFSEAISILLKINELHPDSVLEKDVFLVPLSSSLSSSLAPSSSSSSSFSLNVIFQRLANILKPCAEEMMQLEREDHQKLFTRVPVFLMSYLSLLLETEFPSNLLLNLEETPSILLGAGAGFEEHPISPSQNRNSSAAAFYIPNGESNSGSGTSYNHQQMTPVAGGPSHLNHLLKESDKATLDRHLYHLFLNIFRSLNVRFPSNFSKKLLFVKKGENNREIDAEKNPTEKNVQKIPWTPVTAATSSSFHEEKTNILIKDCIERRRIFRHEYCKSVVEGSFYAKSMDMVARQVDRIRELMVALMAKETWSERLDGNLKLLLTCWNRSLRSGDGRLMRKTRHVRPGTHFIWLKTSFNSLSQKYVDVVAYLESEGKQFDSNNTTAGSPGNPSNPYGPTRATAHSDQDTESNSNKVSFDPYGAFDDFNYYYSNDEDEDEDEDEEYEGDKGNDFLEYDQVNDASDKDEDDQEQVTPTDSRHKTPVVVSATAVPASSSKSFDLTRLNQWLLNDASNKDGYDSSSDYY